MPWYLYLALKQLFPSGRRFPFFTLMSIAGVAIGVMVLLVASSVMGGFGHQIKLMTVDTQGDVQVRADGLIANPAELQTQLAKIPGVVATTPFVEGPVAVIYKMRPQFPGMQGIDVARVQSVIPLEKYL